MASVRMIDTPQSYLSTSNLKLERQSSTGTCCADVGTRHVICNVGPSFDSAFQQIAALQTVNDNPGFRGAAQVMITRQLHAFLP